MTQKAIDKRKSCSNGIKKIEVNNPNRMVLEWSKLQIHSVCFAVALTTRGARKLKDKRWLLYQKFIFFLLMKWMSYVEFKECIIDRYVYHRLAG